MAINTKPAELLLEPGLTPSLYELVDSKTRQGDISSRDILACVRPDQRLEDQRRLLLWAKEFKFWEDYAKIYFHMEDTGFYADLIETIRALLEPKEGEIWLDAGCGPASMSQLVWEKSDKKLRQIFGVDIVLKPAQETLTRLENSIPLKLRYANLGEELPFSNHFFNGIVANICLTYVIDFRGKTGKDAFCEVMKEMFRVLRPGGHIVWSTPKSNPLFWRNFLAGLPDMLSPRKQIQHRVFGLWVGFQILKYGLGIASKGRKGAYTFLTPAEYESILGDIGFTNFQWKKTLAGQVWVNRAEKPTLV